MEAKKPPPSAIEYKGHWVWYVDGTAYFEPILTKSEGFDCLYNKLNNG